MVLDLMLDLSVCNPTATQWFTLRSWFASILNSPGLMVLLLAATLFYLLGPIRGRYRRLRLIAWSSLLPLLLYCALLLPGVSSLAQAGLTIWLPPDRGQTADAIVILGRGPKLQISRAEEAAQLWQAGRAPQIFISGRGDVKGITRQLKAQGVAVSNLAAENCSRTTEENAEITAAVLHPQVRTIILVTDPTHMLRALLTFRSFGFKVVPHLSDVAHQPLGYHFPGKMVREYVGLIAYGIKGRYFPRETSALSPPPPLWPGAVTLAAYESPSQHSQASDLAAND
ncbi:MAG: YdcF family protein [Cyanobacteria bacterium P01_A01_bin.114]